MHREPHTPRKPRYLTFFITGLLTVVLAACSLPRPLGRTPTPPTPIPSVGTLPGLTPTPLPSLLEFQSVPARVSTDLPTIAQGQVIVKLEEQPALEALTAQPGADGVVVTGSPGIDALNQQFWVTSFEPLIEPVADALGEEAQAFAVSEPALAGLYVVSFDPQYDPNAVASAYAAEAGVEYAEPNYYAYASDEPAAPVAFTPNDPYFNYQWHMPQIQAPQAWDISIGQDVLVAVLDTGIAYEDFETYRRAPDLGNTRFVSGYDFVNNDSHPNDDEGHGTHVAGTIAQSTNNGQGVTGVAFGAVLLPVKVLDMRGQARYDQVAQGIVFAADRGARVINLSLSGRSGSSALQQAVDYAARQGVLVVAAAGNSRAGVEYPAAYDNVLAVGSVGYNRVRADYSNFGPQLDLVAPGGDTNVDLNGDGYPDGILQQTFRGDSASFGFYYYEGTSMAAPQVSGVAALAFAYRPAATAGQVRQALESSAMDLGPAGRDNEYGLGLVQAVSALAAIGVPPVITPTPTGAPTPTLTPPSGPSPTPTLTPITPGPTVSPPPISGNIIVNGDFERDGGWTFGPTRYPAGYGTQVVHSGARSVRLGIVDGADAYSYSSVWQDVTIPADARRATLNYWVYPISQDVYPQDQQMVLVLNPRFQVISNVERTLTDGRQWVQRSYDMTPFAGRTVTVYFGVYNGGRTGRPSAMYLDDVTLIVER